MGKGREREDTIKSLHRIIRFTLSCVAGVNIVKVKTISPFAGVTSAVVQPKQHVANVGDTFEFRCVTTGAGLPIIQWTKDGGQLPLQHQIYNGRLT